MIDQEMRNTIYVLHRSGMALRAISQQFKISRNTVRQIIKQQGVMPSTERKDKIQIDPELLRDLYRRCDGWVQRVHELLVEEEGIHISYPTLTRLVRESELGTPRKVRCDRVPDEPGLEMQHDTTDYQVKLAGQRTKVIASLMYLRYSKRRYLRFYRVFNRFAMKCFFHEALMHWGYSATQCIIDNTNLARLRGTGKRAVIVPEMVSFAELYGFEFLCHELLHSNRKAGEERSFWTVETNFLRGRSYASLEDMNQQAFQWATKRQYHRPASKTGLIPAKVFEHERDYLTKLPAQLPAPYFAHQRRTDEYGYVAFEANYYWVPGTKREDVKCLQYADRLKMFQYRVCVAEYPLPPSGVKNARFSPEGQPLPRHRPKNRKQNSEQEEKRLRAMDPAVGSYLDYVIGTKGVRRHQFVRDLFALSRKLTLSVFVRAVERAQRYRIVQLATLQKIAWFCLSQEDQPLPDVDIDEEYRNRPEYQEGCLTDEPDLSIYELTTDPEDESENDHE
ncbi:MAG: helix-turn-helix domain-containing protein [Planctomycetes bacterium]|nr:helix-turn-helix domain-containing protein [Planctomycetota bacterium]